MCGTTKHWCVYCHTCFKYMRDFYFWQTFFHMPKTIKINTFSGLQSFANKSVLKYHKQFWRKKKNTKTSNILSLMIETDECRRINVLFFNQKMSNLIKLRYRYIVSLCNYTCIYKIWFTKLSISYNKLIKSSVETQPIWIHWHLNESIVKHIQFHHFFTERRGKKSYEGNICWFGHVMIAPFEMHFLYNL